MDMETVINVTFSPNISQETSKEHWTRPIALTCDVVSFFLNFFPILVVFKLKRKDKRLPTDILIAALSITDQFGIVLPLSVRLVTLSGGTTSNLVCRFHYVFVFWFQNSAMLIVMTLSCERFLAVVFPFKYKEWSSQKRTYITVSGIYIFAFIIAISTVTELDSNSVEDDSVDLLKMCKSWLELIPKYAKGLFPNILILEGWLSMVVVLICNVSLIKHLLRYKRLLNIGSPSVGLSRHHLRDFTKMVILITILFYVTWLPILCIMTLIQFGMNVGSSIASVCIMATSVNALVNPLVYLWLSKQYRQGYRVILASILKRLGFHSRCLEFGAFVLTSTSYQSNENEHVFKPTEINGENGEIVNSVTVL